MDRQALVVTALVSAVCLALSAGPVLAGDAAPQHGLKTGYLALTYTGEVLPGQLDHFKQIATKVIAAVAQEPGTLMYEWSFRPDQKTFDVVELYQNSDAGVAHVKHVLAEFGKELGQVQKALHFVVYGAPDAQLKQVLAEFNPVYATPIEGFIR
jgi:quinol monooxygenase YgiN